MANTTDYKTKAYTRKAIDAYNAKKWRVTAMFDLEDNVQERIKKLGYSANDFIKTATIKMLEELENGSPKAEKPVEEPKPVEKHDDDTAAVEETHTKSPYEEMISRKDDKPEKVDPEVRRRQILEELGMGADAMAPEPSTETDIQRERELEEMRKYVSEGRGFR